YDLKMLRCKIGRVGPDLRQLFPQQDATGHIPIGPEDDRFHVRDKYWRASTREGAADDHVHLQDVRGPVSGRPESEETELRNVDDDGRGRECRQPSPALEREIDLTHVGGRSRLARGEQPVMRE